MDSSETPPRVLLLFCSAVGTIEMAKSLRIPNGLNFLAAGLIAKGVPTAVENFSYLTEAEQMALLTTYHPTYVGLSMLTLNRFATIDRIRFIRKVLPDARIIVGGPHASSLSEALLSRVPEIDGVVRGEGEETLPDLIGAWEHNGDLAGVAGITWRSGRKIIRNNRRPFIRDLSCLPHPAAHFAYDTVSTSRGCPFQCAFCSSSQYWGRIIRFHSPEWVADEIEFLYRHHGIREISFSDDLFTLDQNRVISICREIINRRIFIRFRCMSRVNTLCGERLEWLKKAGCTRIDFGVESGSETMLKAMQKKADASQIRKAFGMTREAGIGTGCFLIAGFPGEDDRSIALTKQLVRDIRPTFCDISSFAIFPDSPIYHTLLENKVLNSDIWFDITAHTLFVTEDGRKERYVRYVNDLRDDYAATSEGYRFTLSERIDAFKRWGGIGHAALDLSILLMGHEEPAKALDVLRQTAENEPDNPFLWHAMAEACLAMNQPDVALKAVETSLAVQPKNYDSLLLAARITGENGQIEGSAAYLEEAITIRPERIEAHIQKGDLLSRVESWVQAAGAYARALRIDPYWEPLKEALARCEKKLTANV